MKKRIVSICVIVLVLVLALFVLSACDSGRTAVDVELVTNGDFESYSYNSDGDVVIEDWTLGGSWDDGVDSPYGRQPAPEADREEHGSSYIYLDTGGKSGWVYLSQEIAVDRNAVYLVSVDMRVTSLSAGNDDEYKGAYVTFLENPDYYFVQQEETTDGWVTLTFYVRPVNTDYLTIALSLGAEDAECVGRVLFDNVSMMRVDSSSVPSGTTCTISGCRRLRATTVTFPARCS